MDSCARAWEVLVLHIEYLNAGVDERNTELYSSEKAAAGWLCSLHNTLIREDHLNTVDWYTVFQWSAHSHPLPVTEHTPTATTIATMVMQHSQKHAQRTATAATATARIHTMSKTVQKTGTTLQSWL